VGFIAAFGGLAAGGYYLFRYLLAQVAVPGYASTIIAILVLGGLQLLALGIHGEYLGRLHLNVNRKPQYTVRTVLGAAQDPAPALRATEPKDGEQAGEGRGEPGNG
jgi:undecaprenyl-phosphate 4-deoxy-4-formamido-L-arabinose transferase